VRVTMNDLVCMVIILLVRKLHDFLQKAGLCDGGFQ